MSVERQIPRFALRAEEAAAALGMSIDHFSKHVRPDLPVVYSGRLRIYSVEALKRWLAENESQDGRRAA